MAKRKAVARWRNWDLMPGPQITLVMSEADYAATCREMGIGTVPQWAHPMRATTHVTENTAHGEMAFIVTMRPEDVAGKDAIEVAALLVHEATHIWQYHKEHLGEREPSAEVEAYAMQAISQQLFLFYREWLEKHEA